MLSPGCPRSTTLVIAAVVTALLLVACEGGSPRLPTPTAGTTASPTATATAAMPVATGTSTPAPTPSETVASTYFTPTSELPVVRFTSAGGATVDLPVEVPPASEYSIGLSGRESLEGRGMVFYYPGESGGPGFWMRNTHIDLDIAFVAGDHTIISVHQMQADTDEIHHPGRFYLAGIEAPAGWYEANELAAGDRVEFLFEPEEYLD